MMSFNNFFFFLHFLSSSLFVCPQQIDVNIHPTKNEVHFLHEDLIIGCIQETIEKTILNCNSSRAYYAQSLLPSTEHSNLKSSHMQTQSDANVQDCKLVRTDTTRRKLEAFVLPESLRGDTTAVQNSDVSHSKENSQKVRRMIKLTSVLSLQDEIVKNKHEGRK